MHEPEPYKPLNHVRIVTAASLFDGHDAAINVMRRIFQSSGAEVIHLGHDRSVNEIVNTAIQEDVQAVAITSYQGGHIEYFKYMHDLFRQAGCGHIKIFGGGGGVILPSEIDELHAYGITRIYSPDDGRHMGLQGMINDVLQKADFPAGNMADVTSAKIVKGEDKSLAAIITAIENDNPDALKIIKELEGSCDKNVPVIGLTGTGGAGKSSLIDELIRRFKTYNPQMRIAVISVDPTKRKTGGALLGDRIRMNAINQPGIYMRSMATRQANLALSKSIRDTLCVVKSARFDLIILESSGIGQSDTEIVDYSDLSMYIMTPEFGAATQLEKIGMLDYADIIAVNKFDKRGAQDAQRDVKKQFVRNHKLFDAVLEELPVFGTMASQFNDAGVNELYSHLVNTINTRFNTNYNTVPENNQGTDRQFIIPSQRVRYLAEISENVRNYNQYTKEVSELARSLQAYTDTVNSLVEAGQPVPDYLTTLIEETRIKIGAENIKVLEEWEVTKKKYKDSDYIFKVRDKEIKIKTHSKSLSHLDIPKVCLPSYKGWGDILKWTLSENVPGKFPYAAGVFPFKRENEDPTRMFAGEGGPERTNKRFHYLSKGMKARRLSTAFDSVTLYGADPDLRPDIYGKIGNAGVSVSCLDDAKKLYSGFNLVDEATSVSMTINGPAPTLVGYFMNAAIDQQCELYIRKHSLTDEVNRKIDEVYKTRGTTRPQYQGELPEGNNGLGLLLLGVTGDQVLDEDIYQKIKKDTISRVRGTVQADILKEDQAQNTCIFSTDFSLRVMGDMQEYFIKNNVRNFYSVSISGYHIAEAGANPISQLAFTLANGFTYVEYYLSRGLKIDDFAPNFSFFFSNGIDPEYAVMGRVARIIWAKAMKFKYGANERSQVLKYHIQTSGRSLHAQEIAFNDIRTTLQALYAIYDNCNSLHTNAYDEAITTPTEESVRRAMAIQLIINHELGLAKNQNPLQGSFIIEELTELVEEAVLKEFDRISERGGVLGAMETMYQRSRIQEESLYYERLKHEGKLPIMGVNTFLSSDGSPTIIPATVIRSTTEEKDRQVEMVMNVKKTWEAESQMALDNLALSATRGENVFEALMDASKFCTIGSITNKLFSVGGQYRRNM
ncbi:MAG TPA: methylmalonyl-CoA mutase family protein [Lentimicrobium sp.]|nr:methylmalonyl-CoA mutase family protein [Lentimicrobium sp.]